MAESSGRSWRGWHDSVSGRLAAGWCLSAAGVVILGFLCSFLILREASLQRDQERIQAEARHLSTLVAADVNRFVAQVRRVSREPSVEATLLDSTGREQHIAPFMRLTAPLPDEEAREPAAPSAIAVLDYRGRVLASAGTLAIDGQGASAWRPALSKGQAQGAFVDGDGQLVVAFPLQFPGTRNIEGTVLGLFDLEAGVVAMAHENRYRSGLSIVTGAAPPEGAENGAAVSYAELPLVAPLDRLGLALRISDSAQRLQTEVRWLLASHLVAGVLLLAAVLAAAMVTARGVTRPIRELAEAAARRGEPGPQVVPMQTPDGAPREVRQLAAALDEAFGSLERSHAQLALLERAMDSACEGITVVDARQPDLPAVYVNRASERMSGFSAIELIGRNMRMLHAAEETQPALEPLRQALIEGQAHTAVLRNRRKDGTLYMNELSVAPVRDEHGQLTHFVGIQNDVTERLRLSEQLMMSQKMEALGRLTGGLAHDFNNLLGIVIGNLDLMALQIAPDGPLRERLDTVLAAALRGADVTRALLSVARRQPLEPVSADVNAQLAELRPLIRNSVGASISVDERLCPGVAAARLDPNGFDSALLNLVINARHAMPRGGRLTICTRPVTVPPEGPTAVEGLAPGRYVLVQVGDTGVGMSPEIRARAFEPFFSTREVGAGSGLGLATAYGFARQLGGTATIDSDLDVGTTVSLYLPACDDVGQVRAALRDDRAHPAATPASVLVVDDEPHLRSLTSEWLRQMGYHTETAANAVDAQAQLQARTFDVLLTDIVMPGGLDGLALARWAHERHPHLRILLASGYSDQIGPAALPWPLIEKPFRKNDLARALALPETTQSSA